MATVEPYHQFVLEMLDGGMFSAAEIQGKRILILGRCTVEGLSQRIESVLREIFMANGAASCTTYGLFASEAADYTGDFDRLADTFSQTFDIVIHLEGLEKTKNLVAAVHAIKNICAPGGKMLLLARTPNIVGTTLKLNYYEDYWRFTVAGLQALFADCKLLATVTTDEELFTAVKLQRPAELAELDASAVEVFNNKIQDYVLPLDGEYNQGYFKEYRELDRLGDATRTDKCAYDHNYLDKYEFFLNKFRDDAITVLELGVLGGSSLRMWKDYFSQAKIVGVDIDLECASYAEERISVATADLASVDNLVSLRQFGADVIIDDASHLWSHQIMALFTLYETLPHGGVYIIEDMETSVNPELYKGYEDFPISAYEVCSRIARVVAGKNSSDDSPYKEQIEKIGMETELISIMKGSCVLIKR